MMFKTKSEQKLEHLKSLGRPLTDAESDELRRVMHAVYEHERRDRLLKRQRKDELALLDRLREEAKLRSYEWQG